MCNKGKILASRTIAFIIDLFVYSFIQGLIMISLVVYYSKKGTLNQNSEFIVNYMGSLIFVTCLLVFKDVYRASSLGKKIMKLKVVDKGNENQAVTTKRLLFRNLFLIIWPIEVYFLFISSRRERLGDKYANTKVIAQ